MSYDVFFQGFVEGNAVIGGGEAVRLALEPFVASTDPERSFLRIEAHDNGADVYLSSDGMLVNHVEGTVAWDLIVRAAAAAGWTALLPDGPACITREHQRAHLPPDLAADAVTIASGSELLSLMTRPEADQADQ